MNIKFLAQKIKIFAEGRERLVLVFIGFFYYLAYYNVWPGSFGEGGLEGEVAYRLLKGECPWVDVFLSYNLLWFYPIVWIFQIIGPNYIAIKIFFFTLSTITSLIGFTLIKKLTQSFFLSFFSGLLILLVPGQMFRNYMSFLAVANMFVFISTYILSKSKQLRCRYFLIFLSGFSVGITYLIRIDMGILFSVLLFFILLFWLEFTTIKNKFTQIVSKKLVALLLISIGILITQIPAYFYAYHRGFAKEFIQQYQNSVGMFVQHFSIFANKIGALLHPKAIQTSSTDGIIQMTQFSKSSLLRASWQKKDFRSKIFFLNTYLPILFFILIITWSMRAIIHHYLLNSATVLISLGCSLTLFPSFFFWRPDIIHLSEFMVPMTLTTFIFFYQLKRELLRSNYFYNRIWLLFLLVFSSIFILLYYINSFQSGSSGCIATSVGKKYYFHGKNGTNVLMQAKDFEENRAMYDIIDRVSSPKEYLITYPYNPEINFITDRPSYEFNFYVDNDIPSDLFYKKSVQEIKKYKPVVIVINNWDINGTPESRFKNWASATYQYINKNYFLAYQHGNFELFVLPRCIKELPLRSKIN